MALVVQNGAGSAAGANSYIDVAFFKSYHEDRCNSVETFDKKQIEAAVIKATDHLDITFRFVGDKRNQQQTTSWPRISAEDIDRNLRTGVPDEVKEATAEYALISLELQTRLDPIPTRDATGRAVQSKSEVVGPISEATTFVGGAPFQLPKYPSADLKLVAAGLTVRGGDIRRG